MKISKWVVCLVALCLTSGHFGVAVKYAVMSLPEGGWKLIFLALASCYLFVSCPIGVLQLCRGNQGLSRSGVGYAVLSALGTSLGTGSILVALQYHSPIYILPLAYVVGQVVNMMLVWWLYGFPIRPTRVFWESFCLMVLSSWFIQANKGGEILDHSSSLANSEFWFILPCLSGLGWGLAGISTHRAVAKLRHHHKSGAPHLVQFALMSFTYVFIGVCVVAADFPKYYAIILAVGYGTGAWVSLLGGTLGVLGSFFAMLTLSVRGSPGPMVVTPLAFVGVVAANAVFTIFWGWFVENRIPSYSLSVWIALFLIPVSGYIFAKNNPNLVRTKKES